MERGSSSIVQNACVDGKQVEPHPDSMHVIKVESLFHIQSTSSLGLKDLHHELVYHNSNIRTFLLFRDGGKWVDRTE